MIISGSEKYAQFIIAFDKFLSKKKIIDDNLKAQIDDEIAKFKYDRLLDISETKINTLHEYLDDREKYYIISRISQMSNYSNDEIAKALGISRSTFQDKCKKHGIKVRKSKQ